MNKLSQVLHYHSSVFPSQLVVPGLCVPVFIHYYYFPRLLCMVSTSLFFKIPQKRRQVCFSTSFSLTCQPKMACHVLVSKGENPSNTPNWGKNTLMNQIIGNLVPFHDTSPDMICLTLPHDSRSAIPNHRPGPMGK